MSALPAVVPPQAAERNLSARLDALAELVKIGRDRAGVERVQRRRCQTTPRPC